MDYASLDPLRFRVPSGASDVVVTDANGDGYFNVQDYTTNLGPNQPTDVCDTALLNHPGGWDINSNGFLDPQDLIAIFSDGVDDDLNGYIDDISGWDTYMDDNDPHDDSRFYHGSSEARSTEATNLSLAHTRTRRSEPGAPSAHIAG